MGRLLNIETSSHHKHRDRIAKADEHFFSFSNCRRARSPITAHHCSDDHEGQTAGAISAGDAARLSWESYYAISQDGLANTKTTSPRNKLATGWPSVRLSRNI